MQHTITGDPDPAADDEVCCCLSADASRVPGVKTLQFQGQFQDHSVLILVDSGSSTSFISQQLLSQLSVNPTQCKPISVKIANGEFMQCSTHLPDAAWSVQKF